MQSKPTVDQVAKYYSGRSIFITGATGFIGKVIIEKLLYSCPDIDKIYLLIRNKKGESIDKRIKSLINNVLFTRIKETCPERLDKLIPISGDLRSSGLGISREDEETLINEISLVIHSAATVKFNEPLKVALQINYEGTIQILSLCKRMKNIDTFLYVSTTFANTGRKIIEEVIYPMDVDVKEIYRVAERNNKKEIEQILGDRPNTYTFSKALTETYIAKNHENLHTVIVRPSGVTPIKNEPIPGWLDNWFGPTGIMYNIAIGLNRFHLGDKDNIIDIIPVDYVSNLIIIAAAKSDKSKKLSVYHSCSSSVNPVTWGEVSNYFIEDTTKRKAHYFPWPSSVFTKSNLKLKLLTLFTQSGPAYVLELCNAMIGKDKRYVKVLTKAIKIREPLDYFTSRYWIIKCDKALAVYNSLSPEDKVIFACDPSDICWPDFITTYSRNLTKFLPDTIMSKL